MEILDELLDDFKTSKALEVLNILKEEGKSKHDLKGRLFKKRSFVV